MQFVVFLSIVHVRHSIGSCSHFTLLNLHLFISIYFSIVKLKYCFSKLGTVSFLVSSVSFSWDNGLMTSIFSARDLIVNEFKLIFYSLNLSFDSHINLRKCIDTKKSMKWKTNIRCIIRDIEKYFFRFVSLLFFWYVRLFECVCVYLCVTYMPSLLKCHDYGASRNTR